MRTCGFHGCRLPLIIPVYFRQSDSETMFFTICKDRLGKRPLMPSPLFAGRLRHSSNFLSLAFRRFPGTMTQMMHPMPLGLNFISGLNQRLVVIASLA